MGLRFHIPLPGPFSISGPVTRRRTVWTHPGCYIKHPTKATADAHARVFVAMTPEQRARLDRSTAIQTLIAVGIGVAALVVLVVFVIVAR